MLVRIHSMAASYRYLQYLIFAYTMKPRCAFRDMLIAYS